MDNLIYSKILSEPVDYSSIENLFNRFIHNLEINNNLGCLIFLEHKEVFTVGKFSKSKYLNLDKMNGIRFILHIYSDIGLYSTGRKFIRSYLNVSIQEAII